MGKLDDLERLQKLKESGAITTDEFEKVKNKILADDVEVIDTNNQIKEDVKPIDNKEIVTNQINRTCNKCGNELLEDEKFCGKCGNKVNTNNKNVIKIKFNHLIIGFIAVILIIILSTTLTNKGNTTDLNKDNINIETENKESNTNIKNENILSLDDVQMNTFTNFTQANETTQRIFYAGWSYITGRQYNGYPNAKMYRVSIMDKDNYGRFKVNYYFAKSPTSETGTSETVYVWIKDINDFKKMGYYYYWGQDIGWGTPLPDNIGE